MAKKTVRGETVAVTGLTELQRDLGKCAKDVKKELNAGLKKAAVPVAEQARRNLARFAGASLNTIRPRVGVGRVYVQQDARKKTGLRPDWGGIQMVYGLIPALEERQDEVVVLIEEHLAVFTASNGLPMKGGLL